MKEAPAHVEALLAWVLDNSTPEERALLEAFLATRPTVGAVRDYIAGRIAALSARERSDRRN